MSLLTGIIMQSTAYLSTGSVLVQGGAIRDRTRLRRMVSALRSIERIIFTRVTVLVDLNQDQTSLRKHTIH